MIDGILEAIISGVVAFVATSIDNLVILTIFFSQLNIRFRWQHIVGGLYLGFTALVLVSLPGFFGGMLIPRPIIGLLGLVPIAMGVSQWLKRDGEAETSESEAVEGIVDPAQGKPENAPVSHARSRKKQSHGLSRAIAHLLHPQTYSVAAVTFANGGDNIGVYVPLFASSTPVHLVIILITFFLMAGIWCLLAFSLTQHPITARALNRYGDTLVPVILVGLGIYILLENETLSLLGR